MNLIAPMLTLPRATAVLIVMLLAICTAPQSKAGIVITGVTASSAVFHAGDKPISIKFRINEPARVDLEFYDARNVRVRQISDGKLLAAGDHTYLWDGLDERQQPVPAGAYTYVLTATTPDGNATVHDLSDSTGGETVIADGAVYDATKKVVRYTLPFSARMFVRAGLLEGSVLRTIANGVVREAGVVEERWDGWDESKVVSIGKHPKLQISIEGYRLSRNTLIVSDNGKHLRNPIWVGGADQSVKRKTSARPSGLNMHAYHAVDSCRDVKLTLALPGELPLNAEGMPIVAGPAAFHADVAPADMAMVESQRFEIMYFLNNQMLYENEVSYLPYTWTWTSQGTSSGVNYMTAFIVTLGGHYGVSTVRFATGKDKAAVRGGDHGS
ncbi:MAG: hypothetical protein HZB57_08230 [Gammaproteobacteria bacterium]|nr:hypothetical protein [Gammaproteobacteria bacterium]